VTAERDEGAPRRVLEAILAAKADEVRSLRERTCPPGTGAPRLAVRRLLERPAGAPLRLITEIKRRSPSAGPLSTVLSVGDRAVVYARGGATMISVLCDQPFFDGGWAHVAEARAALDAVGMAVPLLAKEFVVDPRQIDEAASRGADAILLIARIVDRHALVALVAHATMRGLESLVEVVTEDELEAALAANAQVIGVNARDLDTLVMDPARAARVLGAIPADKVAIHLSGLKGSADVETIARSGVSAALIGEALMRADDPAPLLDDLRRASITG
jgi:indole-3-glycerol phosphate synthase